MINSENNLRSAARKLQTKVLQLNKATTFTGRSLEPCLHGFNWGTFFWKSFKGLEITGLDDLKCGYQGTHTKPIGRNGEETSDSCLTARLFNSLGETEVCSGKNTVLKVIQRKAKFISALYTSTLGRSYTECSSGFPDSRI